MGRALASVTLAAGFVMGGLWAYEVLGWGGYWGWDPVENGSLVPWLRERRPAARAARAEGRPATCGARTWPWRWRATCSSLYASYLTRSGVLADFSVHSFADEGLTGFLLLFLAVVVLAGFGLLLARLRAVSAPAERMEDVSREMVMLLGLLVLVALGVLVAVGMSAPLIQRALGRSGSVQASYYDGVSGPAAILLGLLMGLAPLTRWGRQEARALLRAAWPSLALAAVVAAAVVAAGLRDAVQAGIVFAAAFALAANRRGMVRGFRGGWRHGLAALAHTGVAMLLVGVVVSSGFGRSAGVVLREGEPREVLGYRLTFEGMHPGADGREHARIAVAGPGGGYTATPSIYWSEPNRGFMKSPHIRRSLAGDVYLSPIELLGREEAPGEPVWLAVGESSRSGGVRYTLLGLEPEAGEVMRVVARVEAESYGRHDVLRPALEIDVRSRERRSVPDCLPDGGGGGGGPHDGARRPGAARGHGGLHGRPGGRTEHQAPHRPAVAGGDPDARQRVPRRAAAGLGLGHGVAPRAALRRLRIRRNRNVPLHTAHPCSMLPTVHGASGRGVRFVPAAGAAGAKLGRNMWILLADMDAFFASVEQLDHPGLRGRPVIVCGDPDRRGVVTAASYEARPSGVRAGMSLARARQLCPEAEYVEGHPERYVALSLQLLDLYLSFTPEVEPFSVDEAFLGLDRRVATRGRGARGGAPGPAGGGGEVRARRLGGRGSEQAGGQDGGGPREAARAHGARRGGVPPRVLAARGAGVVGRGTEARRAHAVARDHDRRRSRPRPHPVPPGGLRRRRPVAARGRLGARRHAARALPRERGPQVHGARGDAAGGLGRCRAARGNAAAPGRPGRAPAARRGLRGPHRHGEAPRRGLRDHHPPAGPRGPHRRPPGPVRGGAGPVARELAGRARCGSWA